MGSDDVEILGMADEVPAPDGECSKRWIVEIEGQAFDVQRRTSSTWNSIVQARHLHEDERDSLLAECDDDEIDPGLAARPSDPDSIKDLLLSVE